MLRKAYRDESMSQTYVFESNEKFHEGQEHVQDEERFIPQRQRVTLMQC